MNGCQQTCDCAPAFRIQPTNGCVQAFKECRPPTSRTDDPSGKSQISPKTPLVVGLTEGGPAQKRLACPGIPSSRTRRSPFPARGLENDLSSYLEPHEGWADALLEKWKRENMADSKTLKAVTAEVWDRRYAAFTPDVARAMRLAQIVYPEKPKDEWWSQQAYELYKEACNLNDELFGNPRAWEAVELLRDALREEPELTGEKVASVIGQERLDYLQNLHKSVTWALRIGPRSSSHHMGIGGGNFALYLAGQAVVLSALRGVSDIDYIGGRGIPSPLRDGQMMYHGADPVHKGVEGFGLDLTHDIKRLAECLKSGDLHKAHELCVERVAFEMAGYAAENQKANSSYASKEIDIMPGWIRGLADVWNLSVLDIYAAPRESRAEPLVVLYGAVGRAMFLCRMIHRPADATAPWDQQTYKIFEEGCVRALGILMDDSGWRAVERLAYAIDKWHLLAGADVRRIIDGDDQTLAHLQEAFKSPN